MWRRGTVRHPHPATLIAPLFALLTACEPAALPPTSATPAPSSAATQAPARTTRIWITAEARTAAAPAQDPRLPAAAPAPRATRYRIEPGSSGYEAVEVMDPNDGRRAPVADAEVAKLVTLARSLAPKMCPGQHSAHLDPEIHFEGEIKLDALGGLALSCAPTDTSCAHCNSSFTTLHAAVLAVVKGALK